MPGSISFLTPDTTLRWRIPPASWMEWSSFWSGLNETDRRERSRSNSAMFAASSPQPLHPNSLKWWATWTWNPAASPNAVCPPWCSKRPDGCAANCRDFNVGLSSFTFLLGFVVGLTFAAECLLGIDGSTNCQHHHVQVGADRKPISLNHDPSVGSGLRQA